MIYPAFCDTQDHMLFGPFCVVAKCSMSYNIPSILSHTRIQALSGLCEVTELLCLVTHQEPRLVLILEAANCFRADQNRVVSLGACSMPGASRDLQKKGGLQNLAEPFECVKLSIDLWGLEGKEFHQLRQCHRIVSPSSCTFVPLENCANFLMEMCVLNFYALQGLESARTRECSSDLH